MNMNNENKRNSFTGSLGFILAAAGSAVGLGNIWRFPYLASKDGGGLFLVLYLILAVTFGFTLLTTEIAIGRKTKQSPLTAYSKIKQGWGFLGIISCVIPLIILPYYCAIGGWVLKYFAVFINGEGVAAADDSYFTGFITGQTQPVIFFTVFFVITAFVVYRGVEKGIESTSKVLMPILILLVIGISVFSVTLSYKDESGAVRTGLQGLKIFLIPDLTGITVRSFFGVLMDAMGQLFYSLSIAMGIMIAYGSYVRDEDDLMHSINMIEIFDTLVACLAGVMIIPAVFTFMGREGMAASGPSLMFVALPKVFAQMGGIGRIIGAVFFAMVLFAAVTSSVSIMEAIVSSFIDQFHIERHMAVLIIGLYTFIMGTVVCLGYNKLFFDIVLPNGSHAQVLDLMDYISNSVLMPIVSIGTCLLIGWIVGADTVVDEAKKGGSRFGREGLYRIMIKYIAPFLLIILFIKSIGLI